MDSCTACGLADGTLPLPGGRISETPHWLVEHCVGPLGLGTLIVKPRRHVTSVAELTTEEAHELGPLLRRASMIAGELVPAEQMYNCLWSHAGGTPVHIHYVVQPVTAEAMTRHASYGPRSSGRCSTMTIRRQTMRSRRLRAELKPPSSGSPASSSRPSGTVATQVRESRTNARTTATSTGALVSTSIKGHPPATGSATSSFHSSSAVRTASKCPAWRVPALSR